MNKSSELKFVLKKMGKIKTNFYRYQSVLTFNTLIIFLLSFFLFLSVAMEKPFYGHHKNLTTEIQKIEKTQIKISEFKKNHNSNTPIGTMCIDSEHCCKHLMSEVKNYFTVKKPTYHQINNYYSKIIILNKFVSEFLRPPIL